MAVNSNTIWYWIQPVTNGRSIAIRMIYWLLDVIGSIFKYNIDSKEVELEVVESSDASCEGCAFNNSKNYYCKDTHCIDVDRKDDIDVIYKKVKRS